MLETVTHARLRALQGDAEGAVKILQAVLARRPGDPEATELLARLPRGPVPDSEPSASAARQRLTQFLAAITRRAR